MEAIKYEPREDLKMFGCEQQSLDRLAKGVMKHENGLTTTIAGILSDAQERLFDDPEMSRQFINRAKYLIFNYLEKD